eukprot:1160656-Pelagomonas_calceolata.AAC.6
MDRACAQRSTGAALNLKCDLQVCHEGEGCSLQWANLLFLPCRLHSCSLQNGITASLPLFFFKLFISMSIPSKTVHGSNPLTCRTRVRVHKVPPGWAPCPDAVARLRMIFAVSKVPKGIVKRLMTFAPLALLLRFLASPRGL